MRETDEVKKLEAQAHGMLPGVAGICLFLLFFTMVNVYAAIRKPMEQGSASTEY